MIELSHFNVYCLDQKLLIEDVSKTECLGGEKNESIERGRRGRTGNKNRRPQLRGRGPI